LNERHFQWNVWPLLATAIADITAASVVFSMCNLRKRVELDRQSMIADRGSAAISLARAKDMNPNSGRGKLEP
jgi:hypothetical protein